jgi:hypothetical protein
MMVVATITANIIGTTMNTIVMPESAKQLGIKPAKQSRRTNFSEFMI